MMELLSVNRSHRQEVFRLCQLLREENARMSFTDIASEEELDQWFDSPEIYLYGAFNTDGQLIGLLKATRGKGNKSHSVYLAAAVHPAYRKQQVAKTLTEYGLTKLKEEGILIARTYIYSWNTASIATIESLGFIQSGRVYMHEYDPDEGGYIDDLIYYKLL